VAVGAHITRYVVVTGNGQAHSHTKLEECRAARQRRSADERTASRDRPPTAPTVGRGGAPTVLRRVAPGPPRVLTGTGGPPACCVARQTTTTHLKRSHPGRAFLWGRLGLLPLPSVSTSGIGYSGGFGSAAPIGWRCAYALLRTPAAICVSEPAGTVSDRDRLTVAYPPGQRRLVRRGSTP
jgi:hypothetical protein